MADVRLLGDMHISPKTVTALKQEGWNIIRVSDALPKSASDSGILNFARQDKRTIVTQDLDFSMLLALGGYSQSSLITLRLSSSEPGNVSQNVGSLTSNRTGTPGGMCHNGRGRYCAYSQVTY